MAVIKIGLDRKLGRVDPRIFGGFVEHLGRCIYGGIYEEGSPLSDERGFRRWNDPSPTPSRPTPSLC
ncbi:MAG: hypothetical protein ACYC3S_04510 [Chloroflexota bacterium]